MRNEPIQIAPAFAVPFATVRHPHAEMLNTQLRTLFLSREQEGERYRNANPSMRIGKGLFESEFRLFQWQEPCVRELREFCYQALMRMVGDLNNYAPDAMRALRLSASSWFHITRRGGYFGLHNHALASWSGIYCVDPGQDDSGIADSGVVCFPHPSAIGAMFVDPALTSLRPPFTFAERRVRLEPGTLILFPSWLMHQVLPYQGDGERITVAFNAWFRLDAPPR